jgi:4-methylaminobutanoate oxidase (formaldehyde-forming)
MRDPDGCIYFKEEVGGLVMGGFEAKAKPWAVDPIPNDFAFRLLDEDWDQFEPLMINAIRRVPALEAARIKMLLNGPESFTPDGNFILGEAPELRGFFVAAGFNSAGIANSGGAGKLIAEWIVGGEAPGDLWDVDIRRFGPFAANRRALRERTVETLGLHYAMRWPRHELESARPLRTSPLYDALAARGAVFGSKNGWERANCFRPAGATPARPGLGKPDWLPWVIAVLEAAAAGPQRARAAAAPVRQRHRHAGRPHRLHADAQRARRLRERPDGDPFGAGSFPAHHRFSADGAGC